MGKALVLLLVFLAVTAQADPSWWAKERRRGANFFNAVETPARWEAARHAGIGVVRLVFTKWKSAAGGPEGTFLVGSLDRYEGLVPGDVARLRAVLKMAQAQGIRVVITPLSLPGNRWRQHNGNKLDNRLWQDFAFHEQSARFWRDLAAELRGNPAVAAYNPLNEPYPEATAPVAMKDWYTQDIAAWYRGIAGTPADLNAFYRRVTSAIREVDPLTPIVLDSGFYATPWAFAYLEPSRDAGAIYAFHMYEPYAFTSYQMEGKHRYPGRVPIGEAEPAPEIDWNREALARFLEPVRAWQRRHGIPDRRIFAAELGVARKNTGADAYLRDLLGVVTATGWHWAFYSFREDTWTGMDYELGSWKLPWKYQELAEQGIDTREDYYRPNPLWEAISAALTVP